MCIGYNDLICTIDRLELEGRPVCVHSSLSSFGFLEGGAKTVVQAFLDKGCTLLAPTFTYIYTVPAPPRRQYSRNGCSYGQSPDERDVKTLFTVDSTEVSNEMGAIPKAVASWKGRQRGYNPINSFSAVGPLASRLVSAQSPQDVFEPIRALADLDGEIVLMGVGLIRLTAIHYAEQLASRVPFVRFAKGLDGSVIDVSVGSCSDGFDRFDHVLAPVERRATVGKSLWRVFPAKDALLLCTKAILDDPQITRCADRSCLRCQDAIAGGPLVNQ